MSLYSVLKFIVNHPLNANQKLASVFRFFRWQLNARLNPYPIIYQYTDKAKLIIEKGMTGATMNMYCGLHDYSDMLFVLHFLRKKDHFIDIGANVGSYTVLAAAHAGATVTAIEPVPTTFKRLTRNISINRIEGIVSSLNIALGNRKGKISFTESLDTMNHVTLDSGDGRTIDVQMDTLDDIIKDRSAPCLMKIDVEGFETEVLNGGPSTLNSNGLKAIIIELNGSGRRYGYDEKLIHEKLLTKGYQPFHYDPKNRSLKPLVGFGTHNTLYIKDVDFVVQRVLSAEKVRIFRDSI